MKASGFLVWFNWLRVAIKNFPHYEIGRTKLDVFIIFHRTGHCLHFSNPYGLTEKDRKIRNAKKVETARSVVVQDKAKLNRKA